MSRFPAVHWRLTPARIAGLYVLFGFTALLVSDVLLNRFVGEPLLSTLQGIKGGVEILLTAGFIFLLVRWSWRDLRLQRRAIDAAPIGVTLTDPDQPDNPLVFVNDQFESMTGYESAEVVGQNCRFLQGPATDPDARAEMRAAVEAGRPVSVDIENYRKNGQKFWNKVDIAPVRNANGEITNFVGFQTDITERKVREQRLRVLNRVLRHNFRNKMTVICGHADLLEEEIGSHEALDSVKRAVEDLQSLTETVRTSEDILERATHAEGTSNLAEDLRILVDGIGERYPQATLDLDIPEGSLVIGDVGLVRGIEEAMDNAVKHNDRPEPTVAVRVHREADGWLTVEVADDGPGIPATELEVLDEGESPLKHGNRLGIWSIHWIVTLAGGSMDIRESAWGGTCLTMRIPTVEA